MVPPEQRSLSMVFQSYAVWPHKTVAQNLAYGLRLRGLDRTTVAEKVRDALAMVRMEGSAIVIPPNSQAASNSASRSPGPWCSNPKSCSSRSR